MRESTSEGDEPNFFSKYKSHTQTQIQNITTTTKSLPKIYHSHSTTYICLTLAGVMVFGVYHLPDCNPFHFWRVFCFFDKSIFGELVLRLDTIDIRGIGYVYQSSCQPVNGKIIN